MTPIDWLLGGDTGVSSKTILSVMTGSEMRGHFSPDVPHDAGDFGRCYRLLKAFPEWRARMPEVAEKYPMWRPMVYAWDELTWLYEREKAAGFKTDTFYVCIAALVDAGRIAAGWKREPFGWTSGDSSTVEIGKGTTMTFSSHPDPAP